MSTELRTTGRRKCASARVVIAEGSGKITVNGKAFEEYFNTEALRGYILQPLAVTGCSGKIDVKATVSGGGKGERRPVFSPDGTRLLFLSQQSGQFCVVIYNLQILKYL